VRDLLRYGLLLRELSDKDKKNYTKKELSKDIMTALLAQWTKANSKFKYPVIIHEVTIQERLTDLWDKASDVSLGRGALAKKEKFTEDLDKLFDILHCKCKIVLCSEYDCNDPNCSQKAHVNCNCKRDQKIPGIELMFIKAQRDKQGRVSTHMIASRDVPETKRQEAELQRQETIRLSEEKRAKKIEELARKDREEKRTAAQFITGDDSQKSASDQEDDVASIFDKKNKRRRRDCETTKVYNTKEIRNIALASMRHHTGLRETAEIATAAWIDSDLITDEDKHLIIDHNKVKRAQLKLVQELDDKFESEIRDHSNDISCLLFDGRRDDTKVMLEIDGSSKMFPGMVKEEHYTVCSEPGGKYLWHFVPMKDTGSTKPAEVIANHIVNWLKERNIDDNLQAVQCDSTNTNTGRQGGVMPWIERKLGRKLIWLVCDLHTNELPLRHLIKELDGPTLSNNKWSGPIGKMLDSATELELDPNFTKITVGPPLIALKESVIEDLSTDQYYGYMIVSAIRSSVVPTRLGNLEIGPVCHSRWLTTALRCCRIWVSNHGLKDKQLENLEMIVQFIVGVYMPNWFNIKVKHSWIEGPRHVLFQLELLRSQCKKVLEIVMLVVRGSAWYAHSEAVIQTLICSDKEEERKAGIEKILEIRGIGDDNVQMGNASVRPRTIPKINADAKSLIDLIDWCSGITEPPLSCSLTTAQIKQFVDTPMIVADWPSHTQSVERCIKMVTEASGHVYSQDRREGYIRSQILSRELMSRNRSKKDMHNLVNF